MAKKILRRELLENHLQATLNLHWALLTNPDIHVLSFEEGDGTSKVVRARAMLSRATHVIGEIYEVSESELRSKDP